jgi:type I restriction enzyme S subunit
LVDRELGEANVNQAVSVFRCAEVVLPDFVAQCFQLPATVDRILGMQVEAARPNISLGDLRRFWFIVPPIPEQHAITEALSDADALIAALEAMIAKKRDLKQAATQQLLTGKTRLPGFSGEWEVKRLGELCDVDPDNLGSGTAPSYFFKYISLEDVNKGQLLGYSELEFRFAPSRARRKLQSDDILVSTVRPNLQAHLHFKSDIEDWVCSTGFAVLRCVKDKSSSGFIFQHLFGDGINQQIEKLITGSNYPAINSREVRLLEILAPCEKEQTAIAEVLWDMDADLTALEARAAKARAVKQGMMQELLTGKVRLV